MKSVMQVSLVDSYTVGGLHGEGECSSLHRWFAHDSQQARCCPALWPAIWARVVVATKPFTALFSKLCGVSRQREHALQGSNTE
jgi:hypothetical protein